MTQQNNPSPEETSQVQTPAPETAGQRLPALLAALIAIVAWAILIFSDGYVAMAVAAIAAALGFFAERKGWRSLATAAIIAALVLIVVTGAFLLVIKYVL